MIRYQLAFGAMTFGQVLTLALLGGRLGAMVSTAVWVPLIVGSSVYAARQPVVHRGMAATHYGMIGAWATLYGLVLGIGVAFFPGDPAWWLTGAVLVALPGFVAARVTSRRVRA